MNIENISAIIPDDISLVVNVVCFDDDYDDDYGYGYSSNRNRESVDYLDKDKIIAKIERELSRSKFLEEPMDYDGVIECLRYSFEGDGDYASAYIFTKKEYEENQVKKEMNEAEEIAARICRTYNVKPNTMDFVHAVVSHYSDIMDAEDDYRNNDEMRMERYAGYDNKDNFFTDNDYSSSVESRASEDLEKVLGWLNRNCPLLMAKYEEMKLAGEFENEEE